MRIQYFGDQMVERNRRREQVPLRINDEVLISMPGPATPSPYCGPYTIATMDLDYVRVEDPTNGVLLRQLITYDRLKLFTESPHYDGSSVVQYMKCKSVACPFQCDDRVAQRYILGLEDGIMWMDLATKTVSANKVKESVSTGESETAAYSDEEQNDFEMSETDQIIQRRIRTKNAQGKNVNEGINANLLQYCYNCRKT